MYSGVLTAQWAVHNKRAKVGPSTAGRREEEGWRQPTGHQSYTILLMSIPPVPPPVPPPTAPPYHSHTISCTISIASSIAPMCDSKSNCCRLNYSGLHKGRRLFTIHLLKCIFPTKLTATSICASTYMLNMDYMQIWILKKTKSVLLGVFLPRFKN